MKRVLMVVGTLLLGVGAVVAQQDAVKEAQTLMKGNGRNAGAVAAIVKGEKPYDQATSMPLWPSLKIPPRNSRRCFPKRQGPEAGRRFQRFAKDLGRQGRFRRPR